MTAQQKSRAPGRLGEKFSTVMPNICGSKGWKFLNPLNAELNSIRYLLALVGARHIVHVSRVRVNVNFFAPMILKELLHLS
jgi:hypothetical protein